MNKSLHVWIGWVGTAIAVTDYGCFSAGLLPEFWFFSIGIVSSILIGWASYKDKVYYGLSLQLIFIVFNAIGAIRATK